MREFFVHPGYDARGQSRLHLQQLIAYSSAIIDLQFASAIFCLVIKLAHRFCYGRVPTAGYIEYRRLVAQYVCLLFFSRYVARQDNGRFDPRLLRGGGHGMFSSQNSADDPDAASIHFRLAREICHSGFRIQVGFVALGLREFEVFSLADPFSLSAPIYVQDGQAGFCKLDLQLAVNISIAESRMKKYYRGDPLGGSLWNSQVPIDRPAVFGLKRDLGESSSGQKLIASPFADRFMHRLF